MRYYLEDLSTSEESPWRQVGRKILTGLILLAALVVVVVLFVFFFYVFVAIAALGVVVTLLAILISSFRHPQSY